MIFQHTSGLVTSNAKTQTRRLWKAGWVLTTYWSQHIQSRKAVPAVYDDKAQRVVYYVSQQLAVQPGRGKPAIARIEVLRLWREDVRDISHAEARREGFTNTMEFLATWCNMHDKGARFNFGGYWYNQWRGPHRKWEVATQGDVMDCLHTRPAERYDALAIEFKLLEGGQS